MKKKVFLTVFCILFVLVVLTVSAQLEINPNNPHYLIYNGQPIFLISDASRSRGSAPGDPYNFKTTITITATGRQFELYNNENLNNGWNPSGWDELTSMVRQSRDQDKIIGVEFWSTPMLEACEGRWYTHFWNSRNGGPIDVNCNGKGEFYTLADYDSEIPGPYDPNNNWSWQRKNQFRQEELVKKYLNELAGFDNVFYIPMYEMGDHWGSNKNDIRNWHQHISKMITDRQPERLIGSVMARTDEQWVAEMDEIDMLLFEGPSLAYTGASSDLQDAYWSYNKPMIWTFLFPGMESPEEMRNAVINGLQPADIIRGGTPEQVNFARRLSDFMATVETWCDEPGQEITSSTVPGISSGSGVDKPPGGSCQDDNKYTQCKFSCSSWSDSQNFCGTRKCKRNDCSTYTETKGCGIFIETEEVSITNLQPSNYQVSSLTAGNTYYTDRAYSLINVPSKYSGLKLIKTANDDKQSGTGVSFNIDRVVNVYVAYDPRLNTPGWLSSTFLKTPEAIGASDPQQTSFEVWKKEFPAGSVSLGINGVGSVEGSMYIVFVEGLEELIIGCGFGSGNDVNNDNEINLLDLICITTGFNKYDQVFDINNDNKINIFDIILIAKLI